MLYRRTVGVERTEYIWCRCECKSVLEGAKPHVSKEARARPLGTYITLHPDSVSVTQISKQVLPQAYRPRLVGKTVNVATASPVGRRLRAGRAGKARTSGAHEISMKLR